MRYVGDPFKVINSLATLDERYHRTYSDSVCQEKLQGYASSLRRQLDELSLADQDSLKESIRQIEQAHAELKNRLGRSNRQIFYDQLVQIKQCIQPFAGYKPHPASDLKFLSVQEASQSLLARKF